MQGCSKSFASNSEFAPNSIGGLILRYAGLPDHWGKWRVMGWLIQHYPWMSVYRGRIRRSGCYFDVDCAQNYLDMMLTWFGGYELSELVYLRQLVPRGGTVFDIGGNIGYHALRFGQMVGGQGRVYSFEPFDVTYQRLCHHVQLNNMPQVLPVPLALRERSGSFMGVQTGDPGASRVMTPGGDVNTTLSVVATSLDAFVSKHGVNDIDLIKMDVEGSELAVCEGAVHVIGDMLPAVFFESNPAALRKQGVSEDALLSWFVNHGFVLYGFEGRRLKPLSSVVRQMYEGHRNVLAIRKGSLAARSGFLSGCE